MDCVIHGVAGRRVGVALMRPPPAASRRPRPFELGRLGWAIGNRARCAMVAPVIPPPVIAEPEPQPVVVRERRRLPRLLIPVLQMIAAGVVGFSIGMLLEQTRVAPFLGPLLGAALFVLWVARKA